MSRISDVRELIYSKYAPPKARTWYFTIAIGLIFAALSLWLNGDFATALGGLEAFLSLVCQILAEAFIVAGVVGMVLGRITRNESFSVTETAIAKVLHEVLAPVRTELLLDAYEFYEWDSRIEPAPAPTDGLILQRTEVHFTVHAVPKQLLIVAVSDSSLLQQYMTDERCLLRWEVASHFGNDPGEALKPEQVLVNGRKLKSLTPKLIKKAGGRVVEYRFNVPKECAEEEYANVRFEFTLLRPPLGTVHYITPTMYKPALRSRFSLRFAKQMLPHRVAIHDTGVLPLSGVGSARVEASRSLNDDGVEFAIAEIPFPTQRRSQVVFEIFHSPVLGEGTSPAAH